MKTGTGQCQCQDHLRRRTNLNRLIIKEYIYQIIKRCKNDARTVQWRVKKTEHSSSVCLVTFHYAQKRKVTVSKSIICRRTYNIYFIYFLIFLVFFIWFLHVSTASYMFPQPLEVIKTILPNQLILCLICHFNQKFCNKREKSTFPSRERPVSHEILPKLCKMCSTFF